MRVMLACGRLHSGGSERVVSVLAEYLSGLGIGTTVVTISAPTTRDYPVNENVKRYSLATTKRRKVDYFVYFARLSKIVRQERPDVQIIMGTTYCPLFSLVYDHLKVPYIISERTDPYHADIGLITKIFSRYYLRRASGLVFQTQNAMDFYAKMTNNKGKVIPNPIDCTMLSELKVKRKK